MNIEKLASRRGTLILIIIIVIVIIKVYLIIIVRVIVTTIVHVADIGRVQQVQGHDVLAEIE